MEQRVIKFRVWWNNRHYHPIEWVRSDGMENYHKPRWQMDTIHSLHIGTNKAIISSEGGNISVDIGNDCILMQFTGLLDCEGKEIYEGDVVVGEGYPWIDDERPNYVGVVEWVFSSWDVILHCVNSSKLGASHGVNIGFNDDGIEEGARSSWKVIGNIFENPELLEANDGD